MRARVQEPFREHNLLLVAATQLAHRPLDIGRTHVEFAYFLMHKRTLEAAIEYAPRAHGGKACEAHVVPDRQGENQAIANPVLGQHGNSGAQRIARRPRTKSARLDAYFAASRPVGTEDAARDLGAAAAHEPV